MGKKEKENDEPPPLNLNIGVMGHVDSGKTSLVKALSTTLSTASLDRAPQSQARGITLDLGFSSFRAPLPEHLEGDGDLQFTLVDCPGHASLIRTIIGGAQIIDAMVLVVDIIKGVQPQTAECLVIGEITTHDLIIALNKVDQISEEERPAAIEAATKKLRRQLSSSKFKDAPVVACAACVGGEKVAAVGRSELKSESIGLDDLVATLRKRARVPKRDIEGPFFFAIDHCFPIRGQGTVVTGTALRGQCKVGDSVELPALGVEKKVKSMQMFRRPAKAIRCGDRAGLCLAQLDAAAIERGVVAAPGSVPGLTAVLALVRKVRFFRGRTDTERTFHVTLGHTTTVATAYFFGAAELNDTAVPKFDGEREYVYQEKLDEKLQWCLLKFEAKVRCQLDALVIGSHLESDAAMADACRIAFHGRLVERAEGDAIGEKIRLYKLKRKVGLVAKLGDPCVSTNGDMGVRDVVGKDLFARETNMAQFVGCSTVSCVSSRRWRLHETTSPRRRRRATLITPQAQDPGRDGRGRQAVLGLWQRGQVPRAVRGPDGRPARREVVLGV